MPTERPVDRIDVIIHELCHFFYRSSADDKFVVLQKSFENGGRPEYRGAFNLLNETLATALGNGIINEQTMETKKWKRYYEKPMSLYYDYHIDKAAKVTLPWIKPWIEKGKTIYDEDFVLTYLNALEKDFGAELTAPKLMLKELVLISDNKFGKTYADSVRKLIRPSSMHSSEGDIADPRAFESYQELPTSSALIVIHPANVKLLKSLKVLNDNEYDILQKALRGNSSIVFAYRRLSNIPAYIISAPTYEDSLKLLEKFSESKSGFTGILNL